MAKIIVRPGGPLLVSGDEISLVDASGASIQVDEMPIKLCRCGASTRKPFCDGSHRNIDFDLPRPATP